MDIIRLTIHLSNRFTLYKDDTFIYEPKKAIEIISGPSGMGKSTLLEYLLPYPVEKTDFTAGGYRELIVEHKGERYTLTSNHKGEHVILANGIKLTKGTTKKEFLHMIKDKFNMTQEIFRIITSKQKFTESNPSQRKDWISLISVIDLTYAFNFFKALTIDIRDLKGSIKLTESKITDITINNTDMKEVNSIKKEIIELEFLKSQLLDRSYTEFNFDIINNIKKNLNAIERTMSKLMSSEERASIASSVDIMKRVTILISNRKNRINDMDSEISFNIEDIDTQLSNIKKAIDAKEIYNTLSINHNDIPIIIKELEELNLMSICNILESEHVVKDIPKVEQEYTVLTLNSNKIHSDINKIESDLLVMSSFKDNDEATCPKCNFKFKPGYNANTEESLKVTLLKKRTKLSKIETRLLKVTESMSSIEARKGAVEAFNYSMSINPHVAIVLSLEGKYEIENLSSKITNKMNELYISIDKISDLPELYKSLDILKEKKEMVMTMNTDLLYKSNRLHKILNNQLSRLFTIKDIHSKNIEKLESDNRLLDSLSRSKIVLESYAAYEDVYRKAVKDIEIKSLLKDLMSGINLVLNDLYEKVKFYRGIDEKIEIYKGMVKEHESKLKDLVQIQKALDPKTGLISHSIESFIGDIIDSVNDILEEIFFYPIYLYMEFDQLDYKFKMMIKDTNPVSDISLASTGQKAMINLAFLIVTYRLLGIPYPILMDEVTGSIDSIHRNRLFSYITNLSNEVDNQIFLVTHNEVGKISTGDVNLLSLG